MVAQSPLSPGALCILVLLAHTMAGLIIAWTACERRRIV